MSQDDEEAEKKEGGGGEAKELAESVFAALETAPVHCSAPLYPLNCAVYI